ncbi:MAG: putative acyl-CoA transferase/carnitine dehydratase [Dehalococcoidales bacterium]|nr:putative acyl-CoA transferase/carnitine dehydratase [Dehalococcoidales bacterium]
MTSALQNIRVIEVGAFQQGPLAAKWLAEAGAEVIKVEGLPGGDPMRGAISTDSAGRKVNWMYEYLNRHKKSVALRLETERGRRLVYRLIEKADVFVSNLRMPALKEWGLDYEALIAVNPRLIYAHGTGFGARGTDSSRPALEMTGAARSGVTSLTSDPEAGPIGNWTPCDKVSALQLAFGISLALVCRERTGRGQMVDSSLLGAGVYLTAFELQAYVGSGSQSVKLSRKTARNPIRNQYQTKDGKWICLGMTQGDRYWPQFCKAIGIEHLQQDPRFKSMAARTEHRTELISLLDDIFASKPRDEWEQILSKYNLIWSVVNTIPELAVDTQVIANEYLVDTADPHYGELKVIGPLVGLSETPLTVGEAPPELGQHTEEVLLQIAGCTWEDLAKLKEEGVII